MTAFRVFSGWDSRQAEAAEVFAYSVRANASIEVDVQFLKLLDGMLWNEASLPFKRTGTTEFSYSRFLVPWLCGYEGRALFGDGCDQLCLGDVAELAEFDMRGKALAVVKHPDPRQARPRVWTSLMLMDCSRLTMWKPERVEREPDDVLMRLRHLSDEHIGELPPEWNVLVSPGLLAHLAAADDRPEEQYRAEAVRLHREAKILHWSYLADPNGGSWIDRSGSALWAEWRERWRAER